MWLPAETIAMGTGTILVGYAGWQVFETTWESWRQTRNIENFKREQLQHSEAMVEEARRASVLASLPGDLNSESGLGERTDSGPVGQIESAPWRTMTIAEIVDESIDCRSYYLIDPSGADLPSFRPGQYLMIRLDEKRHGDLPARCYSLSDQPDPRYWRITIKSALPKSNTPSGKRGLSSYLHDHIRVGDQIDVRGPEGDFIFDEMFEGNNVLIGAGIGITPMICMLRSSLSRSPERPVWLFSQMRSGTQNPFGTAIQRWARDCPAVNALTYFSKPELHDVVGVKYDRQGRFDASTILNELPNGPSKFYLCGPNDWMQSIIDGLLLADIPRENIHWEAFSGTIAGTQPKPEGFGSVEFAGRSPAIAWDPKCESLLEFAEQNDVPIESSCRSGVCGSCVVKLISGRTRYAKRPSCKVEPGEVLACVAIPEGDVVLDT